MSTSLLVLLVSAVLGLSFVLGRRYPKLKPYIGLIPWVFEIVIISLEHWGYKKRYTHAKVIKKMSILYLLSWEEGTDLRDLKEQAAEVVADVHRNFYPNDNWTKEDVQSTKAAFVVFINSQEIWETFKTISLHSENLEVIKATLVAIDIAGEYVDRSDDLGQEYFKHLIFGINKALLLLRDEGTDKKTLKKVVSTIYRTYKLTKAYRRLRDLGDLTEAELNAKISGTVNLMLRILFSG